MKLLFGVLLSQLLAVGVHAQVAVRQPTPSMATSLQQKSSIYPNSINPKGTICCGWLYDIGNVPVGESFALPERYNSASDIPGGAVTMSIGAPTITNAELTLVSDNCTGHTLANGSCSYEVTFTPSTPGASKSAKIIWPVYICDENEECHYSSLEGMVIATSFEEAPTEPCYECGSIINVDGQTIVESIPVVGAKFEMVYSSAMTPEYSSPYNSLGIKQVFNLNGLTVSIQHFLDPITMRMYRGSGEIERVEIAWKNGLQYVVSSNGDEVYVFDSIGKHIQTLFGLTGTVKYTFNYTAGHRLSSINDAFGNATNFTRDGNGNLIQIVAPGGQTTAISLYTNGLLHTVTNPAGEIHELTYKSGTRLVETFQRPGGQISTYTYDSQGRLTKDQSPGGNYWSLSRNTSLPGTPITVSSNLGRQKKVEIFHTPSQPYIRLETHPNGSVRSYLQDYLLGQIVNEDPVQKTTTETVSDTRFGELFKRVLSAKYETAGKSRLESYGLITSWPTGEPHGYWNFSSITETKTINSNQQTSVYTASTKTRVTTSSEGTVNTLTIDDYERPVSSQTGGDVAWSYSYDTAGRLKEATQGTHKKLTYAYNASGYVDYVKNARNEQTNFIYDLAGRITQMTLPDLRVISFSYDANGNRTGLTPPGRPQHEFMYNNFGLLSEYRPPSIGLGVSKNTSYTYNADKQLTDILRPDGTSVSYTYDATSGELTTITTPIGTYSLGYDSTTKLPSYKRSPDNIKNTFDYAGAVLAVDSQRRPSDNLLFGQTAFTFDSALRPATRTVQGNSSNGASTISYSYNGDERPVVIGDMTLAYSYPSGRISTTSTGRISDARTYDEYGDLISYEAIYSPTSGSPVSLYSYVLTRDIGGRISGKTETIQGVTKTYEYTYDVVGRLVLEKVDSLDNTSFSYDSNSNRTSGAIDQSAFNATYDDQDRLLTLGSRTYSFTTNGDLSHIQWNTTQSSAFNYDVFGNLKEVTLPSGSIINYLDDGLDRRVVKRIDGTFQFRYIYEDQHRISAIINGSNAVVKEFIYGTRLNVPDYMKFNGFTYRIITDHLGSPRLIVRTDNGSIAQRMDYNVLGLVKNDTNPGFQPFGFAGGIYDGQTQLVRFGARDYDPRSTGRWTTKDPIRFKSKDINLYGYALNDPINFRDYNGMDSDDSDNFDSNRFDDISEYLKSLKDSCAEKFKTAQERFEKQVKEAIDGIENFGQGGGSGDKK